jgi:hypothetical protein
LKIDRDQSERDKNRFIIFIDKIKSDVIPEVDPNIFVFSQNPPSTTNHNPIYGKKSPLPPINLQKGDPSALQRYVGKGIGRNSQIQQDIKKNLTKTEREKIVIFNLVEGPVHKTADENKNTEKNFAK